MGRRRPSQRVAGAQVARGEADWRGAPQTADVAARPGRVECTQLQNGAPRRLVLLDVENLAADPMPSFGSLRRLRGELVTVLGPREEWGAVEVASGPRAGLAAGLVFRARPRVRRGPDGADLELLRVLREERVAQRFTHVVIGSGDGIFAGACRDLVAAGLHVTAMARPGSLSGALRHAADRVVHLPDPVQAPSSEALAA